MYTCSIYIHILLHAYTHALTETTVDRDLSNLILESVRPMLVLSGDDHDVCKVRHEVPPIRGGSREYADERTLGTVSWMQGNIHPSLALSECVCACMCTCACVCIYVFLYVVCIYVCISAYICVCMHMCVCMYMLYTYIHIHMLWIFFGFQ